MTFHQVFEGQRPTALSLMDLKQIKDAVSELRAASPKSVLADLVEEKIRAIEKGYPMSRPESSSACFRRFPREEAGQLVCQLISRTTMGED